MKTFFAVTSLAALLAVGANAATVDLTYGSGDVSFSGNTGHFSSGGVTGTVAAYSEFWGTPSITQNGSGLGVSSHWLDDSNLDGSYDEWLTFTFDTAVTLMSVTLSSIGWGDDWDVYVDNVQVANNSTSNPFSFGDVMANSFTIRADGNLISCVFMCRSADHYDSFRVASFDAVAPAPVPLPASALLLLGALGGLGMARRGRKSA